MARMSTAAVDAHWKKQAESYRTHRLKSGKGPTQPRPWMRESLQQLVDLLGHTKLLGRTMHFGAAAGNCQGDLDMAIRMELAGLIKFKHHTRPVSVYVVTEKGADWYAKVGSISTEECR